MVVVGVLEPVVHELMCAHDFFEAVGVVEFHGVILSSWCCTCPKVHPAPRGLTLKPNL